MIHIYLLTSLSLTLACNYTLRCVTMIQDLVSLAITMKQLASHLRIFLTGKPDLNGYNFQKLFLT